MNVEISVVLHMCVLGNWVCGHPKITEWVFKAESNPSATHALLNPWYLQCRSCTGRVLCSATTVWASHCPSQRMCGGCYYCNAAEWPLKTAAMDGARRGSPPGVHIQVQSRHSQLAYCEQMLGISSLVWWRLLLAFEQAEYLNFLACHM